MILQHQFITIQGKEYPVNTIKEVEEAEDLLDIFNIPAAEVFTSPHEYHIHKEESGRILFARGGQSND